MNNKKIVHCTNRNHLAAFKKYSIDLDLEFVDECEYEEVAAPPTQEYVVEESSTHNHNAR